MPDNISLLSLEDILQLHEMVLEHSGGLNGVRDLGLLESAIGAVVAEFDNVALHRTLYMKAAAYAYHIAQNQPFFDGNKRTGLLAALVFLDINGVIVDDPNEQLYFAMIAIAQREMSKEGFAKLLSELTVI